MCIRDRSNLAKINPDSIGYFEYFTRPLSHWEKRISLNLIRICFQHSILYRIQPSKSKIDLFEIPACPKNTRNLYITLRESAVRVKMLLHIIGFILHQRTCETSFVGLKTCIFLTFFQTSKSNISTTKHRTAYRSIPTDTTHLDLSAYTPLSLVPPS